MFLYMTTIGPSVAQRVHRLNPEKLKVTKAEFDFRNPRICHPTNSQWASILHLVERENGKTMELGIRVKTTAA